MCLVFSILAIALALAEAGDTTYTRNAGQRKEYVLRYAYTGIACKADHVPFYEGSDIDASSVKSAGATLCPWHGNSLLEAINWYLENDVSTTYVYITNEYLVYTMNENEFREFLLQRAYRDHDSRTHQFTLRIRKEYAPQIEALNAAIH